MATPSTPACEDCLANVGIDFEALRPQIDGGRRPKRPQMADAAHWLRLSDTSAGGAPPSNEPSSLESSKILGIRGFGPN
jgi:hypothetical protein